jgi:hypothetical protein
MQVRFKHLVEDRDRHGNVRVHVRVPGRRKVRIKAPFGTDEFIAAYNAAVSEHVSAPPQARAAKAGSFRHACVLYYASATFKRLDPATQSWRRRALDSMCENHADKPVAQGTVRLAMRGEAGTRSSQPNPERAENQVRDRRPPFVDFRGDQAVSRSACDRQQGALGARSTALHWGPSRRCPSAWPATCPQWTSSIPSSQKRPPQPYRHRHSRPSTTARQHRRCAVGPHDLPGDGVRQVIHHQRVRRKVQALVPASQSPALLSAWFTQSLRHGAGRSGSQRARDRIGNRPSES